MFWCNFFLFIEWSTTFINRKQVARWWFGWMMGIIYTNSRGYVLVNFNVLATQCGQKVCFGNCFNLKVWFNSFYKWQSEDPLLWSWQLRFILHANRDFVLRTRECHILQSFSLWDSVKNESKLCKRQRKRDTDTRRGRESEIRLSYCQSAAKRNKLLQGTAHHSHPLTCVDFVCSFLTFV